MGTHVSTKAASNASTKRGASTGPEVPEELLDNLLSVFSARGFDGASLQDLARASNRSKASLYHHFPGGKGEMIQVLVERCEKALDARAFAPLRAVVAKDTGKKHNKKAPAAKAERQLQAQSAQQDRARLALASFVDGFADYLKAQRGNCLLATLALSQPELLGIEHKSVQKNWLATLATTIELAGHRPKAAKRLAQASLARLYGSLTLSAMGSSVSVARACKWLKRDLLRP